MKTLFKLTYVFSASFAVSAVNIAADSLPGTKPLTESGNLAEKQVAGMHKYLDRALAASVGQRQALWRLDFSSPEAYAQSVEPNRARLRKLLGVVDERVPPNVQYVGGPDQTALVAEADRYRVFAVRWAVLPGVEAEGLLLEPKEKVRAVVIAVPDADQTPEQLTGLAPGVPPRGQFARRLAEHGCRVLVPALIDRRDDLSASPKLNRATNQPHREFVYRMAYEMGRTLTGYEVQKVLAAVDWACREPQHSKVAVFGYGEGGGAALFAAALDPRIDVAAVSGWLGPRERVADEPIYRNAWGLLTEFGDGELLRLVLPRRLVVEVATHTAAAGPPPRAGRGGAAPGRVEAPDLEAVRGEIDRTTPALVKEWKFPRERTTLQFALNIKGEGLNVTELFRGPGFDGTLRDVLQALTGSQVELLEPGAAPADGRKGFSSADRHRRQFDQLVAHTQKLWRGSDATRKEFWKKADASSPEAWEKSCSGYRDYFHTEVIGKLPEPTVPLNPRTRQVYDEKTWTGYEVVLDVYDDVFATGILLLPKDLKPGEKRPVVVCQHGLEGTPRDTIEVEKRTVYNQFSRRLVELGYIVYAPQNPYYGQNGNRSQGCGLGRDE